MCGAGFFLFSGAPIPRRLQDGTLAGGRCFFLCLVSKARQGKVGRREGGCSFLGPAFFWLDREKERLERARCNCKCDLMQQPASGAPSTEGRKRLLQPAHLTSRLERKVFLPSSVPRGRDWSSPVPGWNCKSRSHTHTRATFLSMGRRVGLGKLGTWSLPSPSPATALTGCARWEASEATSVRPTSAWTVAQKLKKVDGTYRCTWRRTGYPCSHEEQRPPELSETGNAPGPFKIGGAGEVAGVQGPPSPHSPAVPPRQP